MTGLWMWLTLMTQAALGGVVNLPAGSCTGGDDTAAIQGALTSLRDGDTLRFPRRAGCQIRNGVVLGDWHYPGGLKDITIDGNGATITAMDDMTTLGAVFDAAGTRTCVDDGPSGIGARKFPMLTVSGVDDLRIYDLTFDGNTTKRSDTYHVLPDIVCASSANLRLQLVRRARVEDVTSIDAFADGVLINGLAAGDTVGVTLERHQSFGAARNNVSITNCTDCEVRDSELEGAFQGFDIEPDRPEQRVSAFKVLDSKIADTRQRCASISSAYDNVSDITVSRNLFTRCALDDTLDSPGRIFAIHSGARGVAVTDNQFFNIDITSSPSRRLISLQDASYTRFERNVFDQVWFSPTKNQSLLYFFNDGRGAQATHVFRDNDFRTLPTRPTPTSVWWCLQFKNAAYHEAIEAQVYQNWVPSGSGSVPVNGCRSH